MSNLDDMAPSNSTIVDLVKEKMALQDRLQEARNKIRQLEGDREYTEQLAADYAFYSQGVDHCPYNRLREFKQKRDATLNDLLDALEVVEPKE